MMAKVVFTPNVQRHVACPQAEASGRTVREHMAIFVDGAMIRDRARLSDAVRETSTIYVFQALSGG
jgi:hypothetical protein